MVLGAAFGAAFGVWQVCARLPGGLGWGLWLRSAAWSIGGLVAVCSLAAGLVGLAALLVGYFVRASRRPLICALAETIIFLPLLTWLLVNEFVYSLTLEVMSADVLLLIWHDTAAVFENAWAMAGGYLVITGVILVSACGVIAWASAKSFRRLIEASAQGTSGKTETPPPRRWWAAPFAGGLTVLVVLLGWGIHARPSEALTVTCRSVPPLRAFNLVQLLSDDKLRGPIPDRFGSPVVTEQEYAERIGSPRTPAPNVVYLLLESTPARALHCYGNPLADVSPNLDRLANEGVRFTHCIAPSSFSSCSVVSLATSLYMLRGKRFDYFSDITYPFLTLPRALKLAGYELAMFSSGNETFDNINRFCRPTDFDTYFSQDTCPLPQPDCMRMDDHIAVGEFARWIAARTDPRPFYCGFYLQSPHFNYEVPEPWASHYQPVPPLYSNGDGILHIPADVLPKLKNQYHNAVRYMDYWVGRILADLDQAGVLGRTLIVATGDHGEAFMEHGLARHGVHTWEEMVHTPLIVWAGPEIRAALPRPLPSAVTAAVSGIDIAPTVADLVGIAPYPGWQGVNVLDPDCGDRGRPVFSMTQYTRWQETVYLDKIKYLYDLTDALEYLFDLQADPDERNNLATCRPELATAMRSLLAGWHTWQLTYYSQPNRSVYVGDYAPDPTAIETVHRLAEEQRGP